MLLQGSGNQAWQKDWCRAPGKRRGFGFVAYIPLDVKGT